MSGPSGDLATLAAEFWASELEAQPLEATALGIRDFDDRVPDRTPEANARRSARLRDFAGRARVIPEAGLDAEWRISRACLIEEAEGAASVLDLDLDAWTVDVVNGIPAEILNVPAYHAVATPDQATAMVRRWQAFGGFIDAHTENLRRGLATGRVAARTPIVRDLDAVTQALATDDAASPLAEPLRMPHDDWSGAARDAFAEGILDAIRGEVRPALERLRTCLADEILPAARPDDRPGIGHVPGGEAAYRTLVRRHTTLELTPDELHATGLAEVARINAEMEALGRRALGAPTREETLRRLRVDPAVHFTTRAEIEATARAALARADEMVPGWFGRLPRTGCAVVPMAAHEEEHSTIAYYRPAAVDGSRPGQYYLNTSHPETRPRYEAECLAFHESVPGHHLQIAIAQELTELPEFRRHLGATAFWEGWGLYTERLADEMGLYSGDLDRLGMLSMDAWRACRLVVDTGMHAKGWTRRQALDYMAANSALAENNIANEVDRYIVWPGQALAYKAGQLEMLRLRADAAARLGPRFDIRRFHDALLGHGAIGLAPLRGAMDAWVAAELAR